MAKIIEYLKGFTALHSVQPTHREKPQQKQRVMKQRIILVLIQIIGQSRKSWVHVRRRGIPALIMFFFMGRLTGIKIGRKQKGKSESKSYRINVDLRIYETIHSKLYYILRSSHKHKHDLPDHFLRVPCIHHEKEDSHSKRVSVVKLEYVEHTSKIKTIRK